MTPITLIIAGEPVDVLFDGHRVTSPEFPDQNVEFTARCGMRVTQQMLVDICKTKPKETTNE